MLWLLGGLALTQGKKQLMSWEQYSRTRHTFPFVLDIRQGKGEVMYFGIQHTHDPLDKQFAILKRLIASENPELILNEDITPSAQPFFAESVKRDGERGALAYWANQRYVPMVSIDMSWINEANQLAKSIPKDQIKMFYFLRGFREDIQRDSNVDRVALQELQHLQNEGITWPPNTIADVDKSWKKLGIKGDWRKPQERWITPLGSSPLNVVSRKSSDLRDEHMIDVLSKYLKEGKRVLAVVGGTHVITQEPALPWRVSVIGNR